MVGGRGRRRIEGRGREKEMERVSVGRPHLIILTYIPSPLPKRLKDSALMALAKPSCLQTTSASRISQ